MVSAYVRGTTVAAAEAPGTQTITVAGMTHVQPKAARIFATWADASTPTTGRDNARWSDYFIGTDGSTAGNSFQSANGVGLSNTDRYGADDGGCVVILDPAGTVLERAAFGQWINGGMEIEWGGANSNGVILHVEFWFGDRIQVAVGQDHGGEVDSSKDIAIGFMPDHLETISHTDNYSESVVPTWHRHWSTHIRNPGLLTATSDNFLQEIADSASTTRTSSIAQTTGIIIAQQFRGGNSFIFGYATNFTTFLTDGFRVNTTGQGPVGMNGPSFAWMAISYGGNRVKMQRRTVPAADGIEKITDVGFRPWSATTRFLARTSNGQDNSDASGQAGIGFADEAAAFSASTNEAHGVGTSDNSSRSVASLMSLRNAADSGFLYECDVDEWHESGLNLGWSNVDGSAYLCSIVYFERDQIIGCGAGFLPLLEGAADGLVGVIGSGDGVLPLLEGAGTGAMVFSATANTFLPLLDGAGLGAMTFTAAGAGTLPLLEAEGAALVGVFGSGNGTLPMLRGYGTGRLLYYGCAHGLLPNLESAGTGTVELDAHMGTGAGVLPLLTGYGTGRQVYRSMSGCTVLPLLGGAGIGAQVFAAAGDGEFPLLDGAGAGLLEFRATGPGALPLLTGSGSGLETFLGSGSGLLPLPLGAGDGTETFAAAGAGTLPLPLGTGAALVGVIGSGAGVLPLLTGTGTGATDTLPFACDVELDASRDLEANLTASRDLEADLTASRDQEAELPAGRAIAANLLGSYDGEANFLGSCD